MTWIPKHLTRKQMEERRRKGGRLLQAGKQSQAEIARRLGISRATVSDWAKQVAAGGLRALQRRSATGRPSHLTTEQEKRLVQILKRGAPAAGFPTERWTMGRVQQIIRREFNVVYHVHYMNRLLERLDWSLQQPLASAQEQDEELIRAWIKRDWPRIKKSAAARRKHSVF
ncbi:MAG: winged helix-turn-helix domain-containing protein [Byssovorax cruenta]|jgi:putative transposase